MNLKGSTIIYCNSPESANKLAEKFLEFCLANKVLPVPDNKTLKELIEWIDHNVHKSWILRQSLSLSIGLHHGSIPRHLASSIIDLFNEHVIKYLFCTSTLIEGVNTTAENVVFFHNKKGIKSIDYFDAQNIVGRAGRMKKHFIGKIYKFNKDPDVVDVNVDIPIYTQENAPLDLLIHIDKDDLKEESVKKLKKYDDLEPELQELLKQNKGMSVEGQLNLIAKLTTERELHSLLCWNGIPNHEQLTKVIELGQEFLLETNSRISPGKLAFKTLQFTKFPTINSAIAQDNKNDYWIKTIPNEKERIQKIIQETLDITQNWFEYRLPKIISIMSNIQAYVYKKIQLRQGNYEVLNGMIENQFLPSNLLILLDYGIPPSAISKLGNIIREELPINDLVVELSKIDLKGIKLLDYEINKINRLIK